MSTASYIAEYLKQHHRVAVPWLGKFYLKNSQAKFDEKAESILPPSKEIEFNVNYEIQDDELCQFLAQEKAIPLADAEKEIENFTNYLKNKLSENQEVDVRDLGKFIPTENKIQFIGNRIESDAPDFYGLEEINLTNLNSGTVGAAPQEEYKFQTSVLWIFLLVLPVLGLIFLGFTQRERLFGKKSFDDLSVKTSTHRIQPDSAKIKKEQEKIRLDSLRRDSIVKDSIAKTVLPVYKKPVRKYNSKNYNSKKWRKSKKRANR